jgi:hypothetical protein
MKVSSEGNTFQKENARTAKLKVGKATEET